MFASFFPRPKLLLISALVWTGVCMAFWYAFLKPFGPMLTFGNFVGAGFPLPLPANPSDAAQAA